MIEVREARDDAERAAAMAIRHTVFVDEQEVPVELEVDGLDDRATHLVAVRDGTVVATCRLIAHGAAVHLGRLAVDASARRQGIAGMLVGAADEWAREHGADRLMLSAQTYAAELYLAAGYIAVGKSYLEAGIEHVDMELELG
jgi:predicted GNAT family N-acyltransferase